MIDRRKSNGLCIQCGKPLDRTGIRCIECNNSKKIRENEDRKWYSENGYCPRCHKNKLFGDEKNCPECSAKAYGHNMNKINRIGKQKFNEQSAEMARKRYRERSENGICTRCGKRKSEHGFKTCGICRAKDHNRKQKYKKPDRTERYKMGLCYFCDNPVKDGYKVCENHYNMNLEKARSKKSYEARKELKIKGVLY